MAKLVLQPSTRDGLRREDDFLEKVSDRFKNIIIEDRETAVELASSMCNVLWSSSKFDDDSCAVSFTFRAACGIVAGIRDKGEDYLDYYFAVKEGVVSDRVKLMMSEIGYYPLSWNDFE